MAQQKNSTTSQDASAQNLLRSEDSSLTQILDEISALRADLGVLQDKPCAEDRGETRSGAADFLLSSGHRIRTPLNGVIGMLELIAGKEQDPELCSYTKAALFSANSLHLVLNDLIDYCRFEEGDFELHIEPSTQPMLSRISSGSSIPM